MCRFIINGNPHPVNRQQLIYRAECFIYDTLRNLFERTFFPLERFCIFLLLRSNQGSSKYFLINFKYLFQTQTILYPLPQIQKIISYQRNNQQNETKDNSHCLINIRTFQLPTISFQCLIFSLQLIQICKRRIIITIRIQLFQCQKSNRRLISYIQYHMVIRIKKFVPPQNLSRYTFTDELHIPMRSIRARIFLIMLIQQQYGRISILQSNLILLIHISEISRIGII